MDGAFINALAVPVTALLALVGAPLALRRAGFAWSKVVFGTLTAFMAGMVVANVIVTSMIKTGWTALPVAWLVPAAMALVIYRLSRLTPS